MVETKSDPSFYVASDIKKPPAIMISAPASTDSTVLFFEKITSHQNGKHDAGLPQADDVTDTLYGEGNKDQRVSDNADNPRYHDYAGRGIPFFFNFGAAFSNEDIRRVKTHAE